MVVSMQTKGIDTFTSPTTGWALALKLSNHIPQMKTRPVSVQGHLARKVLR